MTYNEFATTQQPNADEMRRARGDAAQARKSSEFRNRIQAMFNEQHDPAAAAAQALSAAIHKAGNGWQNDAQTQSRVYFNNVQINDRLMVDGYYDCNDKSWHAKNAMGLISDADFGAFVLKNIVKV